MSYIYIKYIVYKKLLHVLLLLQILILRFCKFLDTWPDIVFNENMTDDISNKVIDIFKRHKRNKPADTKEKVKTFAGFSYVRLDTDVNGYPFKEENLLEYAKECHYIVKVMREKNGSISLYSYSVPNEKLLDFLLKFRNNELNGTIIEIDKFLPKDLA